MPKKLFAFWGRASHSHFFAMVPASMPNSEVIALAQAATGDANREGNANLDQGSCCDDGLCVEESIQARLRPLGFEFLSKPEGLRLWEGHHQVETLLEARLRSAGHQFRKDQTGRLIIETQVGEVIADPSIQKWEGQGTTGGLKTSQGIDWLLFLLKTRSEAETGG